ncbi:hypothetical protein RCL1_007760 [Eukaryota sp. TZLM3-RCL]
MSWTFTPWDQPRDLLRPQQQPPCSPISQEFNYSQLGFLPSDEDSSENDTSIPPFVPSRLSPQLSDFFTDSYQPEESSLPVHKSYESPEEQSIFLLSPSTSLNIGPFRQPVPRRSSFISLPSLSSSIPSSPAPLRILKRPADHVITDHVIIPNDSTTETPLPRARTTSISSISSTTSTLSHKNPSKNEENEGINNINNKKKRKKKTPLKQKKKEDSPVFEVEVDVSPTNQKHVSPTKTAQKRSKIKRTPLTLDSRTQVPDEVVSDFGLSDVATDQTVDSTTTQLITDSITIQSEVEDCVDDHSEILHENFVNPLFSDSFSILDRIGPLTFALTGLLPVFARRKRVNESHQKSSFAQNQSILLIISTFLFWIQSRSIILTVPVLIAPIINRIILGIRLLLGFIVICFAAVVRIHLLLFTVVRRYPAALVVTCFFVFQSKLIGQRWSNCESFLVISIYWLFLISFIFSTNLIALPSHYFSKFLILIFGILLRPCVFFNLPLVPKLISAFVLIALRLGTFTRLCTFASLFAQVLISFSIKNDWLSFYYVLLLQPLSFLPFLYASMQERRTSNIRNKFLKRYHRRAL